MTDEERKEAERLAHEQDCFEDGFDRGIFDILVNMYEAACEAKRVQIFFLQEREAAASRAYLTERRRVRPLIRACQVHRNLVKGNPSADHDAICFALAQYEEFDRGEDESPNKYRPWEALGISETKYYKNRFIRERVRFEQLLRAVKKISRLGARAATKSAEDEALWIRYISGQALRIAQEALDEVGE